MKKFNWAVLGLTVAGMSSSASASTIAKAFLYTEFEYHLFDDANHSMSKSRMHFAKRLKLSINQEIDPIAPNPDYDIPSHGHANYYVSGKAEIDLDETNAAGQRKTGDERCDQINFSVLWHQKNGPLMSTKELLDSGVDSGPKWNYIPLCLGYKLKVPSARKLMIEGSNQVVELYARGIDVPVAKGVLVTEKAPPEVKPAPSDDPYHRD